MASFNPLRGSTSSSLRGGAGFNAHAAGMKMYGAGRHAPNVGKVGAEGKKGYSKRDAQRNAILKRRGGM